MTDDCDRIEPLHSAWIDGVVSAAERAAVADHLADCERCRDEIDSLTRARSLLRSLPQRRLPAGLLEDLGEEIGEDLGPDDSDGTAVSVPPVPAAPEPTPTSPPRRRPRTLVATALACLGVLGGAAFALGDQPADAPLVRVPVDQFVSDHLQTVGSPTPYP